MERVAIRELPTALGDGVGDRRKERRGKAVINQRMERRKKHTNLAGMCTSNRG